VTRHLRPFIGGAWQDGRGDEAQPLMSPASGERLALVDQVDAAQLDAAVDAAWEGHRELAAMTAFERATLANRVADLLEERAEDIARELSHEHGKPLAAEARPEVAAAVEMFRDAAEGVKRLETAVIPSADPNKRVITIRQPRGVYGVLSPWNFPLTIPSEYLSAALATGNGVVWKPSELTPVTAANLAECFVDAGVPAGALNLLFGPPADLGAAICAHPGVVAVGLTGSSRTGEAVARAAAGKPLLLELGGNCPVIVFDDADLDDAIAKLGFGCFANAGQICDSVERILVHARIHDELVEGLVGAASELRLGSPFEQDTTLGPVIAERQAATIDAHIADAVGAGATLRYGGARASGHPTELYYQPTVITGVSPGMRIEQEETFGPLAAVIGFHDEDEAVKAANASPTGLVSAVFTRDIGRAIRVAERLETGMVNINDTTAYWQPHTPFGGFSGKRSGIGRLGGRATLEEMTQLKTINVDIT
jgi:acyl-CoA reductase-like NAD-dependent aldehyde dehydrogenase